MKTEAIDPQFKGDNAGVIAQRHTAGLPYSIGSHMNSRKNQKKMIQRLRPKNNDWPIPDSLMDFDVPEELKYLLNSEGLPTEDLFLLHDCGQFSLSLTLLELKVYPF